MKNLNSKTSDGQSAVEYLLIVAVVAIIALVGFNRLLPAIRSGQADDPNSFSTKVSSVILSGERSHGGTGDVIAPQPIAGGWCTPQCPPTGSGGPTKMYKTCECPAPAFIPPGQEQAYYCHGDDFITCS